MAISDFLKKDIKITACADGFVSVYAFDKDKRLGAALPFYSVDTWREAITLIGMVCKLKPCNHGGKTGLVIEPRAPNWPKDEEAPMSERLHALQELTELFRLAHEELEGGTAPR